MNELTRNALYKFLLSQQVEIQAALDQDDNSPEAEVRRGQWAMAQKIMEHFELGKELGEMGKELH
jgi:hypothetical protein